MKNWTLFNWAVTRLKIENDDFAKNFRNKCLLRLMDLSGVKPVDVFGIYYRKSPK